MANLIITVIAIALVAVASLMGAYYGGSAFLNNQSAADASTVLNEGQQIAGAWQAFLSDNYNNPPDQISCLTGGACAVNSNAGIQYLANIPNYPAAAGTVPAGPVVIIYYPYDSHYYALADVGAPGSTGADTIADPNAAACYKILKAAKGTFTNTLSYAGVNDIVNAAAFGNGTFGCSFLNANGATPITGSAAIPTTGHYLMAYKLS
jgi:hypothetical protein